MPEGTKVIPVEHDDALGFIILHPEDAAMNRADRDPELRALADHEYLSRFHKALNAVGQLIPSVFPTAQPR